MYFGTVIPGASQNYQIACCWFVVGFRWEFPWKPSWSQYSVFGHKPSHSKWRLHPHASHSAALASSAAGHTRPGEAPRIFAFSAFCPTARRRHNQQNFTNSTTLTNFTNLTNSQFNEFVLWVDLGLEPKPIMNSLNWLH